MLLADVIDEGIKTDAAFGLEYRKAAGRRVRGEYSLVFVSWWDYLFLKGKCLHLKGLLSQH